MKIVTELNKNPMVIAASRAFETSSVVSVLAFLGQVDGAVKVPGGIGVFDWRGAVLALALGIGSGFVNALIVLLNLWKQSIPKGTS